MRVTRPLAWLIVALGVFTAGLLRQFHHGTPTSPFVSPAVGSLLFAAIIVVLLVSAREWRTGAVRGAGIRLGSLTPLLLMLLLEKWVAITIYPIAFDAIAPTAWSARQLDALYRGMAGFGLILVCLLVARFSRPAFRRAWDWARPARWLPAAAGTLIVVLVTYLLLAGIARTFGARFQPLLPQSGSLLALTLGGQGLLAFAEELYFRGILLAEIWRLAPRLGVRRPAPRRWLALGITSLLFGMEHVTLDGTWSDSGRELIFALALGLLFGLIVLVSANLHFAAGLHAWINWLLLGAAPHLVDADGTPAVPPGTYIGLAMILAFVLAYVVQRGKRRRFRSALDPG